jgi:hypothetical protein
MSLIKDTKGTLAPCPHEATRRVPDTSTHTRRRGGVTPRPNSALLEKTGGKSYVFLLDSTVKEVGPISLRGHLTKNVLFVSNICTSYKRGRYKSDHSIDNPIILPFTIWSLPRCLPTEPSRTRRPTYLNRCGFSGGWSRLRRKGSFSHFRDRPGVV